MKTYSQELTKQHHKRAKEIKIQIGDIVMVKLHTPISNSNKLSPKFKGPYKALAQDSGNKFKVQDSVSGDISIRHVDKLKLTHMPDFSGDASIDSEETHETNTETLQEESGTGNTQTRTRDTPTDDESHVYRRKLRSHNHRVLQFTSTPEPSIEIEFYEYVNEMLDELNIDRYSFYR